MPKGTLRIESEHTMAQTNTVPILDMPHPTTGHHERRTDRHGLLG